MPCKILITIITIFTGLQFSIIRISIIGYDLFSSFLFNMKQYSTLPKTFLSLGFWDTKYIGFSHTCLVRHPQYSTGFCFVSIFNLTDVAGFFLKHCFLIILLYHKKRVSQVVLVVKNLPVNSETVEPGGLQSMGLQIWTRLKRLSTHAPRKTHLLQWLDYYLNFSCRSLSKP